MHKFLRAAGFSMYTKKKDIEKLLDLLERQPSITKCVQVDEESNVCEMRAEVASGLGISIVGELNEEGNFEREYYFPYLESNVVGSTEECSVQRHTEKETYSGMVDENRVGITLIFYIQNFLDFREKMLDKIEVLEKPTEVNASMRIYLKPRIGSVCFSGMSIGGKVLLPIKKSQKQIQKAKVSAKERSSLIEAAKNGDEDAMETLTIEDIDLYSQISRRAMKEDLYSIIDSCFMPCGVECDQYSIIGEIKEVEKIRNIYTKEEIYRMKIESHDLEFMVCINSRDLLGEPQPGRRFKGQIWMQGTLNLVPYKAGPMDQKR